MKSTLLSLCFLIFSCTLCAQAAKESVRIFPNPVATSFEIGTSGQVSSIRVLNMVGREVKQFTYAEGTNYNIADLPQGMYLVQLRDAGDEVVHTQRVKKN